MQIISSIKVQGLPIACVPTESDLLVGLWGGDGKIRASKGLTAISCAGVIPISRTQCLILGSKNKVLLYDQGAVEDQFVLPGALLVHGLDLKTQLFMHNTIQQQRFLCLINLRTQQRQIYEHINEISAICPLESGVLIGDKDGYLNFLSESLQLLKRSRLSKDPISFIKVVKHTIYVFSDQHAWTLRGSQVLKSFDLPAVVTAVETDGSRLYAGTIDGQICVIDREVIRTEKIHENQISSISFDEKRLITSSFDRSVKLWHLQ